MTHATPVDWDGESYCACECGCAMPATHQRMYGMEADTLVVQMLCCFCSIGRTDA